MAVRQPDAVDVDGRDAVATDIRPLLDRCHADHAFAGQLTEGGNRVQRRKPRIGGEVTEGGPRPVQDGQRLATEH